MGEIYSLGGDVENVLSSDLSAIAKNVLNGKTYVGNDTDDELGTGTMPEKSGTTQAASVDRNGTDIRMKIPTEGHYDATSYLKATGATFGNAKASEVLSGKKFTSSEGLNTSGTIPSKAAATYNVSTSNQTISTGQYLSGVQTFRGVTTSGIAAGNIRKGVTVKVGDAANPTRIQNVTGTWYGNKKCIAAGAYDIINNGSYPSEEASFTMPDNGTVYYGGCSGATKNSGRYSNTTCAIYKNGAVVDNRDVSNSNYVFRGTMVNKSFAANKGDVIKVRASASRGSQPFSFSFIQAVIVY